MSEVNLPSQARSTMYPVVAVVESTWCFDADNGNKFLYARVRPLLGSSVQVQVSPLAFNDLSANIGNDVELVLARQYKRRAEGTKYADKAVDNCIWWVTDVLK